MKPRVLLISSVHPPTDPRIVYKIGHSLSIDYEVFCILPNARPNSYVNNVKMVWLPYFQRLIFRLVLTHPLVLWKCLFLRPAIIHIFVPELIPIAFVLKWFGARVIYEVQENLYKKFEIKRINNRPAYQLFFRYFDRAARRNFQLILTEKSYLNQYDQLKYPAVIIQNFVSTTFIDRYSGEKSVGNTKPVFFYSGVISMERCFDTLVAALIKLRDKHPDFHVHLFGPVRFNTQEATQLSGYEAIKSHFTFHGYTDLKKSLQFAANSVAGIALLKPLGDYPESYSTKLFEYMALNLPLITSDFPLYQDVVRSAQCGFCISPYDSHKLSETMDWLISNPDSAESLGRNGRIAAIKNYNWVTEEKALWELYKKILPPNSKM